MKARFAAVPAAVVVALLVALGSSEGRRYTPYYDSAGILTVCKGITGRDVIPGKTYTPDECDRLERAYVERMYAAMGRCVTVDLEFHEIKAWGHFAYNVGEHNFCQSTAAKLLQIGQNRAACKQIPRWRFITINGQPFDCSTPGNTVCMGLWHRRLMELAWCEGQPTG